MKLIKISENVMVNPDLISVIQFREINGAKLLVVTVDGEQHVATVTPIELMTDLANAGIGADNKLWQYWAG